MMGTATLACVRCGSVHEFGHRGSGCSRCKGQKAANLAVMHAPAVRAGWDFDAAVSRLPGVWRYRDMLAVAGERAVTLGEGGTPLVRLDRIARDFGLKKLFVKDESRNPTNSFKDRLSTVAVTHAVQLGVKTVATASTGNAGASLAAYAARAGLRCVVVAAQGAAGPMLSQIQKLGAQLVLLKRMEDRWPLLEAGVTLQGWLATSPRTSPVVGSLPVGIEGYKTIAYEIAADLGCVPDWVVLPVAYGDALCGIVQGFADLFERGVINRLPRLVAAEAHGSLMSSMYNGDDAVHAASLDEPALDKSVDVAQSTYQALKALRETDGVAIQVGNAGLIAMQESLAHQEGIFLELASVMPLIAVQRLVRDGMILPSQTVICLGTAAGWKDSDVSTREFKPLIADNDGVEVILNRLVKAEQGR